MFSRKTIVVVLALAAIVSGIVAGPAGAGSNGSTSIDVPNIVKLDGGSATVPVTVKNMTSHDMLCSIQVEQLGGAVIIIGTLGAGSTASGTWTGVPTSSEYTFQLYCDSGRLYAEATVHFDNHHH